MLDAITFEKRGIPAAVVITEPFVPSGCPQPLTPAAVYDAISFYYDHQDEIDQFMAASTLESHAKRHRFVVGDDGHATRGQGDEELEDGEVEADGRGEEHAA